MRRRRRKEEKRRSTLPLSAINNACVNKPGRSQQATSADSTARGGALPAAGRCHGTREWDRGVWSGSSGWAPPDPAAWEPPQPPTAADRVKEQMMDLSLWARPATPQKIKRCGHVPHQVLQERETVRAAPPPTPPRHKPLPRSVTQSAQFLPPSPGQRHPGRGIFSM